MKTNNEIWYSKMAFMLSILIFTFGCNNNPEFSYGQLTDIDGNNYKTIQIGNQVWMAENLRVTTYRDGMPIEQSKPDEMDWIKKEVATFIVSPYSQSTGINSNEEMIAAYGLHYNWNAVSAPEGLCPEGWRIPTSDDLEELIRYISEKNGNKIGDKLKSCFYENSPLGGTCATGKHPRWNSYKGLNQYLYYGTNNYGFSALPAGYVDFSGVAHDLGQGAYWWIMEEENNFAKTFGVGYSHANIISNNSEKQDYYSVRCIKN